MLMRHLDGLAEGPGRVVPRLADAGIDIGRVERPDAHDLGAQMFGKPLDLLGRALGRQSLPFGVHRAVHPVGHAKAGQGLVLRAQHGKIERAADMPHAGQFPDGIVFGLPFRMPAIELLVVGRVRLQRVARLDVVALVEPFLVRDHAVSRSGQSHLSPRGARQPAPAGPLSSRWSLSAPRQRSIRAPALPEQSGTRRSPAASATAGSPARTGRPGTR
jgi:hypothetical protein